MEELALSNATMNIAVGILLLLKEREPHWKILVLGLEAERLEQEKTCRILTLLQETGLMGIRETGGCYLTEEGREFIQALDEVEIPAMN